MEQNVCETKIRQDHIAIQIMQFILISFIVYINCIRILYSFVIADFNGMHNSELQETLKSFLPNLEEESLNDLMKQLFICIILLALSFAKTVNAQTALTFDGSNNYKNFGKSSAFAISGDLTVEAKLKSKSVLDYCPLASNLIQNKHGNTNGYWLGIDTSGHALFSVGCSNADRFSYDIIGTSSIDDEKWHHISGVINTSGPNPTAMIYVDGVLENTLPIPNPLILSNGTFYIGSDVWSYFHQGDLNDVRLWKRALSSTEITQNLDDKLVGNENGLVALYHFAEGTSDYKAFLHSTWNDKKEIKRRLSAIKKDKEFAEEQKEQAEKEKKLAVIKKEQAEHRLIIVGLIAISLTILIIFLRYRGVQSKKVILKQALLETAEQEQKILTLTVQQENRNVRALSLELIFKKNFSETILKKMREFEAISKADLVSLEIFIQNELDIKSSRAHLQNQMGELSSNFYSGLKINHPNLTELELKLAGMVVMKMSNKEIAVSKNTTLESSKKAKYRLKKKLNVSSEDNLASYLNEFL